MRRVTPAGACTAHSTTDWYTMRRICVCERALPMGAGRFCRLTRAGLTTGSGRLVSRALRAGGLLRASRA